MERTAITIVHVMPLAMKPACSRIQTVSKSAAAKSATSEPRITAQTATSLKVNGMRAERSSSASRLLSLGGPGGGGGGAARSPPLSELVDTMLPPAHLTTSSG